VGAIAGGLDHADRANCLPLHVDGPASWRKLIDACVDGVMTSKPVAFQRVKRSHREPSSCPRP
jgi:hypothetical protein